MRSYGKEHGHRFPANRLMHRFAKLAILFTISSAASIAAGQQVEFVERFNNNYLKKEPAPGAELPDLTLTTESGEEYPLSTLRGKHTVLVYGCLT